jgi:hypothetical protein
MEPATFQLVAQCLSQLRHQVSPWKVYTYSKSVRFETKSLELYEAKYGYVWHFLKYVAEDVTVTTL